MLLNWLGERRGDAKLTKSASMIERALDQTITRPECRTADLGGTLGTQAFGQCVAQMLVEPAQ